MSKKKIESAIKESKENITMLENAMEGMNKARPVFDELRFFDDDLTDFNRTYRFLQETRNDELYRIKVMYEVLGKPFNGWYLHTSTDRTVRKV